MRRKNIVYINLFYRTYINISQSKLSLGNATMGNGRLQSEGVILLNYDFKEFNAVTVFRKEGGRQHNPWEISQKIVGKIQEKQDEPLDFFGHVNKARKQIKKILTTQNKSDLIINCIWQKEKERNQENLPQVSVLEDGLCCVAIFLCRY